MKSGYVLAGMPLGRLLPLLWRRGLSLRPRMLLRALFALQAGFWASFLGWLDRRLFGAVAPEDAPRDPVVIIGHWRSGTTFLHQLMSQDPGFVAPTLLQCGWPGATRAAARYLSRLMGATIGRHRPMDNVRMGVDEPQEDEWATFRLSGISPLEDLLFPRHGGYFLLEDHRLAPGSPRAKRWARSLRLFLAAIVGASGRRALLKNPFHARRIPLLREHFPQVRFVYIVRDPRRVLPSTLHLWAVVGEQNAMHTAWAPPREDEVLEGLAQLLDEAERDLAALEEPRRCQLRFEDLEAAPMAAMERLYGELGLELSGRARTCMERWLASVSGYRKNVYDEDPQRNARVVTRLEGWMQSWGYLDGSSPRGL